MNTKQNTFTSLVILILLLISYFAEAQNTYLKITLSDQKNDYVSFPPNTKFELFDATDTKVYSNSDRIDMYKIDTMHTLVVYPSWKDTTDTFKITNGKVEQVDNSAYFKALSEHSKNQTNNYGAYSYDETQFTNGLTMKKIIYPSAVNPELYNATFEFNNGISASYLDGKFVATLNNKQLQVEGHYLIYSNYGLIKLSFRPSNGETWWVFEPKE
ncbi:hypothetical protein [Psychroserpens mesophilus]|uniref:hypothetical protein n=1 Tax=Psychroserpens mesophilus TaxID=325473 RepID=UPI003F494E37